MFSKIRVGVVRGGVSPEYDVSLKTGGTMLKNLPADKYVLSDILIAKDGKWHLNGAPILPESLRGKIDVAANALHGFYGEDGKIQRVFEDIRVPYTGSGPTASAIGMNKALAKNVFRVGDEIKTPLYKTARKGDDITKIASEIWRTFPQPSIVKPVSGGSSIGVTVARTLPELAAGLEKAFEYDDTALIEEYVNGREVFCGAVHGLRGEKIYITPPLEVIGSEKMDFLDYGKKIGQENITISSPAQLNAKEKELIAAAVRKIYRNLSLRHYAGFDFIVSKRDVYLLEVNTLPGLTEDSFLPKSLSAVGVDMPQFLGHVVSLALAGE